MRRIKDSCFVSVISELWRRYFQDGVGRSAAALAYYLLFSVFPLLVFFNYIIGLLNLSADDIISKLGLVLPDEIIGIFVEYLAHISTFKSETLFYVGIVLLVYFVSKAVRALMQAVQTAYRIKRHDNLAFHITGILFTALIQISIFMLFIVMMLSSTVLQILSKYIHISHGFEVFWGLIRFAAAPALTFFLLVCFYRFACQKKYSRKSVIPGAVFALAAWVTMSVGFSYYVGHLSKYSFIYGSLGAIMILMLWLYLTGTVLILGGELNHIIILEKEKREGSSHE